MSTSWLNRVNIWEYEEYSYLVFAQREMLHIRKLVLYCQGDT